MLQSDLIRKTFLVVQHEQQGQKVQANMRSQPVISSSSKSINQTTILKIHHHKNFILKLFIMACVSIQKTLLLSSKQYLQEFLDKMYKSISL